MKTIIINHYPTTMTFNVRQTLPEFTFNCPVRNKILHRRLRRKKVDSPSHSYTDYGVDCITVFDGGEIWEIGS